MHRQNKRALWGLFWYRSERQGLCVFSCMVGLCVFSCGWVYVCLAVWWFIVFSCEMVYCVFSCMVGLCVFSCGWVYCV